MSSGTATGAGAGAGVLVVARLMVVVRVVSRDQKTVLTITGRHLELKTMARHSGREPRAAISRVLTLRLSVELEWWPSLPVEVP